MKRARAIAVLAVAATVATVIGGCGVQPTGVNVASTSPFSVPGASSSPSASAPGGASQAVAIYLMPKGLSYPSQVFRYARRPPASPLDLLPLMRDDEVTADERAKSLVTYVTDDIQLEPTNKHAHEYQILSDQRPTTTALRQMACTFDLYWHDHPDGRDPSTQFILPSGYPNGWDDCSVLFGVNAPATTGKAAKTFTSAIPSIGGTGN